MVEEDKDAKAAEAAPAAVPTERELELQAEVQALREQLQEEIEGHQQTRGRLSTLERTRAEDTASLVAELAAEKVALLLGGAVWLGPAAHLPRSRR